MSFSLAFPNRTAFKFIDGHSMMDSWISFNLSNSYIRFNNHIRIRNSV